MNATRYRQRGAALVIGLVLLLILTLLAITGMNTASTELIMAGNTQYQARAFQAAETGIEQVIAGGVLNPAAPETLGVVTFPNGDEVNTTTRPRGNTLPPPGFSFGTFSSEHFEITSAGTSLRNASSTHTQGLFLVTPAN